MRILFIGDVVGRAGLDVLGAHLPNLIRDWAVDLTVVNGENSAPPGFGITEDTYGEIVAAGADAVTLGNHTWNRKETLEFIDRAPRLLRPINYLPAAPGLGAKLVSTRGGERALVVNALGRLFMEPIDDPFSAIDRALAAHPLGEGADAIVVDFHCEATGEKQAAGHFCDGRASLVAGTHTHTPSADYRVLPGGTAYITDAGMTGDYDSVVGMRKEAPLGRFTTGLPSGAFEPASGAGSLCGVAVETDARGLAVRIAPVRIGGHLDPAMPTFWGAVR